MTTDPLIQAILRQTTVLVARLATTRGGRSSLAQVPDQVFLELVRELERQGVSRKVSADMFGVGLRTHRRKILRLLERSSEAGRSLWELTLEYIAQSSTPLSRQDVLHHFARDDELQVRAVLRDLCASGLVDSSGSARRSTYRASSRGQLAALAIRSGDGTDASLGREVDEALDRLRVTLGTLRESIAPFDGGRPDSSLGDLPPKSGDT